MSVENVFEMSPNPCLETHDTHDTVLNMTNGFLKLTAFEGSIFTNKKPDLLIFSTLKVLLAYIVLPLVDGPHLDCLALDSVICGRLRNRILSNHSNGLGAGPNCIIQIHVSLPENNQQ